jgi:hypothetical protein
MRAMLPLPHVTDNSSVPYALCLRGEAASRIGTTVVSVCVVVVLSCFGVVVVRGKVENGSVVAS